MIPTIISIIIYVGFVSFLAVQTLKLKNYLIQMNAFEENSAVLVDSTKYFVLTTNFPFSAIKQRYDGAYWFDETRWNLMKVLFVIVTSISGFSFLILLLTYI